MEAGFGEGAGFAHELDKVGRRVSRHEDRREGEARSCETGVVLPQDVAEGGDCRV